MKKLKTLLLAVLFLSIALAGCGKPQVTKVTQETLSIEQWATEDYLFVAVYQRAGITSEWTQAIDETADFESISQEMKQYSNIAFKIKPALIKPNYRLQLITFDITTNTDCILDFSVSNPNFKAESLHLPCNAGIEQTVVITIGQTINKLFDTNPYNSTCHGFQIGTFRWIEIANPDLQAGVHGYKINDKYYTAQPSDPTVKLTFSNICLSLEKTEQF